MELSHPSLALGLVVGVALGSVGLWAFTEDRPATWRTECAADAVRVFVTSTGDITAIIDPECDHNRAGLDYPTEDA